MFPDESRTTTRSRTRFTRTLKVAAVSRLDTSSPLAALLLGLAGAGDWAGGDDGVESVLGAALGSGGAWAGTVAAKNVKPVVRSSPTKCRSNRNCRERSMRSFLAPADCPWAWQRKSKGTARRRPVLRLYAAVYFSVNAGEPHLGRQPRPGRPRLSIHPALPGGAGRSVRRCLAAPENTSNPGSTNDPRQRSHRSTCRQA